MKDTAELLGLGYLVSSGQAGGHIAPPVEELAAERRNIPDGLLKYQPGG